MSGRSQRQPLWLALPIIGFIFSEMRLWRAEQTKPCYRLAPISYGDSNLPPYPLDMEPLLALPHGILDEAGVPYNVATKRNPASYQPTTIAEYGLANWNAYLATRNEKYKHAFITQARWLVAHETHLTNDAGGWHISCALPSYFAYGSWLSAMTQGNAISVLVRAYRLTKEDVFLQVARRAVRTFEWDIRDGGVSTFIDDDGVFFEEVAVYPAAHILNGHLFALFGLYDYVALTDDMQIAALIRRSLNTLQRLIDRFDMGYWSRYDLLHGHPGTRFYHSLHVIMLEALARYSGCEYYATLAVGWAGYQQIRSFRVRSFIVSRIAGYRIGLHLRYSRSLEYVFSHLPIAVRKNI